MAGSARAWLAASLLTGLCALAAPARGEEQVHASGLRYEVVPPPGWDGKAPLDLLLCLHGSGDKLSEWKIGLGVLVPELRRHLRLLVQSPAAQGWPQDVVPNLAALTSEVRAAHPVRRTLVFGFSAGGNVATLCLYQHPDLFQGALVGGATTAVRPPREGPARERWVCFSIGADDPIVGRMGGAEGLRGLFKESGWEDERVRIDIVPGIGHTLSRPHLLEGLDWLLERAGEAAPASDEEQTRVAVAGELVESGDEAGLRALTAEMARSGREARALLARALEPLLSHKDPARARLGAELLGWLAVSDAVPALDKALDRHKRAEEVAAAVARALGRIPDPAAEKALLQVIKRSAWQGPVQVAAADGLAVIASESALRPLVDVLKGAEKRKDEALCAALERALRETTGQPLLEGAIQWSMWLKQRK